MKKIDLYIIRKFLGTFFYSISLIIVIVIVFDFSERVDDFIDKNAPFDEVITKYYLNFIPYFVNLFIALFTFIAVIYFTSKMAVRTEIIAILSSGISFKRLMLPYLVSAFALTGISYYLGNFVIPQATKRRIAFEEQYVRNRFGFYDRDLHMQIAPNTYVYVESYNDMMNTGYQFTLEKFNNEKLTYKLSADYLKWDTLEQNWTIENYAIRMINGMRETISRGTRIDTTLNFTPKDFVKKTRDIELLSFNELNTQIHKEKLMGSNVVQFYQVEKHKRIAFPFATIVMTLIGVSLSSRKVRGGIGIHLGTGITLSFTYILFMQVSSTFALYGSLHPGFAIWIPNIIYLGIGLALLRLAPK